MTKVRVGVVGTGWWATQHHIPGRLPTSTATSSRSRIPTRSISVELPRPSASAGRTAITARCSTRARSTAWSLPCPMPFTTRSPATRSMPASASWSRSRWSCGQPRRGISSHRSETSRPAARRRLHVPVHPRRGTREARAQRRRGRRPAAGLRALCVDGAVVLQLATGRIRRCLRVPADRAEGGHLLEPGDLGRRPGPDADHARDGDGPLGDRRPCRRGQRQWPTPGSRSTSSTRSRTRSTTARSGRWRRRAASSRARTEQLELRYYGNAGYVLQHPLTGALTVQRDGPPPELPETPPDDVYPAHATARCLVDLVRGEGENRAPARPAAATVEFLEAAYRSVAEQRPIRVDELSTGIGDPRSRLDAYTAPTDVLGSQAVPESNPAGCLCRRTSRSGRRVCLRRQFVNRSRQR